MFSYHSNLIASKGSRWPHLNFDAFQVVIESTNHKCTTLTFAEIFGAWTYRMSLRGAAVKQSERRPLEHRARKVIAAQRHQTNAAQKGINDLSACVVLYLLHFPLMTAIRKSKRGISGLFFNPHPQARNEIFNNQIGQ
jgi:hypothetical protein